VIKYRRMMVDVETLGKRPNAVVFQVGCTFFDPTLVVPGSNVTGQTVGWYLQIDDQLARGAKIETDTLLFWTKDNSELWKNHMTNMKTRGVTQIQFGEEFRKVWSELAVPDCEVWANGVGFDIPKLERLLDWKEPWKYWKVMDFRTMKRIFDHIRSVRAEVPHDALHDAMSQAQHLEEILKHVHHD